MIYVDTSVLVALHLNEPASAGVARWYAGVRGELVSAVWCVTEFASALGIKQRTGQIDESDALGVWARFERQCAGDLRLLTLNTPTFHHAAQLSIDAASGLRAGDALHLAAAIDAGARHLATLDELMANHAVRLKLRLVKL